MLACGVVRCFSLSIGKLVYYKLLKNLQLFHTRDSPFYSECKDNKFSSKTNHISAENWLNRQQIAILFSRDIKTIGKHINNALKEELDDEPVVAKFATTAADGKIS